MTIDRLRAKQVFADYVKNYDDTDTKVKLKIVHTYKVCDLCERIARSIGMEGEDVEIAWLMGLLHDVGRFEQLRQFGTFQDSVSINHAHFGADILFEEGKIRDYVDDGSEDELLRTAIWHHSDYQLPEDLSERSRRFCNILRDADKIDILRVNVEFPLEEIYNTTVEELKGHEVTKEVMDAFHEQHCILRSLKRQAIDNVVGHISLVYELVFPISLHIVEEQEYLEQLMGFQSEHPVAIKQFEDIRTTIHNYMQSNKLID